MCVSTTRVERDSVNSVALCDDRSLAASASSSAGQCSLRMMVASSVHLNSSAHTCTARDTTIMPNIQALLAIVAITFAPNVELRFVLGYSTANSSVCFKTGKCRMFTFGLIWTWKSCCCFKLESKHQGHNADETQTQSTPYAKQWMGIILNWAERAVVTQ